MSTECHYKTSAQLKSLAKGQLLGKYPVAIGSIALMGFFSLLINGFATLLIDTKNPVGMLIHFIVSFLIELFLGIFSVGQKFIYLSICCNRPCKVSDLFFGFKHYPDKAILLTLIVSGISTLCILPSEIVMNLFYYSSGQYWIFACCMLLILGCIIAVYASLVFSQVYLLLLDFPEYSVKQILSLSIQIMKGQKGRLFYITVGFLPLYLLTMLSCGIGLFWLTPYVGVTQANFYLDLIKNRQS